MARQNISRAQKKQKRYYDQRQRMPNFKVGDRAFLFMPAEKSGHARKFARPYHGPYRILELDVNTARVRRVDRLQEDPILVHLDRLRRCPTEIADECWPPGKKRSKRRKDVSSLNDLESVRSSSRAPRQLLVDSSTEEGIPDLDSGPVLQVVDRQPEVTTADIPEGNSSTQTEAETVAAKPETRSGGNGE